MSNSSVSDEFHVAFESLITILGQIMSSRNNCELIDDQESRVDKAYNLYCQVYMNTKPTQRHIHSGAVNNIYVNNRDKILQGVEDVSWLLNNKQPIDIVFPTGKARVELNISHWYKISIELGELGEKKMEGRSDAEYDKCKEIFLTDNLLLGIYKVFHSINDISSAEKDKLSVVVKNLEKGLEEDPPQPVINDTGAFLGDIKKLGSDIKRMVGGLKLPDAPDGTKVDASKIADSVGSIFESGAVETVFSKLAGGINSKSSLSDALQTALDAVQDVGLFQNIQDNMAAGQSTTTAATTTTTATTTAQSTKEKDIDDDVIIISSDMEAVAIVEE